MKFEDVFLTEKQTILGPDRDVGSIPKTHSLNISAQNLFHDFSMYIGEAVISPLITVGEAFMVDPHQVLNGRVKVMHVDGILGDVVAPIVGLTVGNAAFHTTTGQPDGKTTWMVVSPE